MVCEAYVPPTVTVQLLPEPAEIVPRLVPVLETIVMPTTRAGEVVVVSAVPVHDAPGSDIGTTQDPLVGVPQALLPVLR